MSNQSISVFPNKIIRKLLLLFVVLQAPIKIFAHTHKIMVFALFSLHRSSKWWVKMIKTISWKHVCLFGEVASCRSVPLSLYDYILWMVCRRRLPFVLIAMHVSVCCFSFRCSLKWCKMSILIVWAFVCRVESLGERSEWDKKVCVWRDNCVCLPLWWRYDDIIIIFFGVYKWKTEIRRPSPYKSAIIKIENR